MMLAIALLIVFVANVNAACDNSCSGHGTCMTDDVCKCYDNYGIGLSHDSGDCSERVCPFEIAWVDTPNKLGSFHKYSECANRGVCNRDTGECECFEGYEGKGCARTTCPNDCSGHGTCEYIEDLHFGVNWFDYTMQGFNMDPKTFPYKGWDSNKVRGCVCDATYGDIDCSKRLCPFGTDVLDVRDDLLVSLKYHQQQIVFQTVGATTAANNIDKGQTFALTFTSKLNETFSTIPIVFDPVGTADFANDIQLALLNLPNRVIDGVSVTVAVNSGNVVATVSFTGNSVQGAQNKLLVEDYICGAGCTPRLSGLHTETRVLKPTANVSETQRADYNSFECGRRGKCDYASGLCSCFLGYTGDNCNTMTTLV